MHIIPLKHGAIVCGESLAHYGTPRHSGRYPWGSGENPYHHGQSVPRLNVRKTREEIKSLKKQEKLHKRAGRSDWHEGKFSSRKLHRQEADNIKARRQELEKKLDEHIPMTRSEKLAKNSKRFSQDKLPNDVKADRAERLYNKHGFKQNDFCKEHFKETVAELTTKNNDGRQTRHQICYEHGEKKGMTPIPERALINFNKTIKPQAKRMEREARDTIIDTIRSWYEPGWTDGKKINPKWFNLDCVEYRLSDKGDILYSIFWFENYNDGHAHTVRYDYKKKKFLRDWVEMMG